LFPNDITEPQITNAIFRLSFVRAHSMLESSHSGFEIRSAQLLVGYRISNKHSSACKFDSDFIGRTRAPFPLTDHTE